MSNLVEHARVELALIGEEAETTKNLLRVVQAFADSGHSGGSASVAIAMLHRLLQYKNLSPLTNSSEEWQFYGSEVWGDSAGIWQNRRCGEAFSNDGGKTYYLLSELSEAATGLAKTMHTSATCKDCEDANG